MLFKKQLRWEISNATGAIFLVLLTIIFIFMMIKALGNATNGKIAPQDVLMLMSLSSVLYLPHIIISSIFIASIMVFTRWYENSEMTVWHSSGLPLAKFLLPLWNISLPFFILIAVFSLFIWPWSNSQIENLKRNFQQRDDISLLVSGQFFEVEKSKKILFIENIDSSKSEHRCANVASNQLIQCKAQNSSIKGIFATNIDNQNFDIITAQNGNMHTQNNDRYIKLNQGQRYISNSNKIQNISFESMDIKLQNVEHENDTQNIIYPKRAISSLDLWQTNDKNSKIELYWRIGLPFSMLILQLWALVLAHANPRKGKYFNIILAIIVYIAYNNLINISQVLMQKQNISLILGSSIIHISLLLIGGVILYYRSYSFYFIKKYFNSK